VALHLRKEVPLWPSKTLIAALGLYFGAVTAASWWVDRRARLRGALEKLADRLTVLLYIYLPLVVLSLAVVLIRNVF